MTHYEHFRALDNKANRAKIRATALRLDGDLDGHAAWLSEARRHRKAARVALELARSSSSSKVAA